MTHSSVARFFPPLVVSFMLVAACIPGPRRETVIRPEAVHEPRSIPALDARIAALSERLEKGGLSDRDRNLAVALLSAYNTLDEALQRPLTDREKEETVRRLYDIINTIDENVLTSSSSLQPLSRERERILGYYLAGDHGSVIEGCLGLEQQFGPEALSPEIGLVFALSLGQKGMHREALKVAKNIKRQLEGNPDLVSLQARMIEWHLALGQRTKAFQTYEALQDQLDERAGLLKEAERSLSRQEPATAFSLGTSQEPGASETDSGSLQSTFTKVDALIRQHRFEQAKFLLIRQRIRSQEGPEVTKIDRAMTSVEEAEARFHQEEAQRRARRQENLERAARMMEEERYDEVIAQIDTLEKDGMVGAEADALRDLAVEKLVNRERNRAAKLFLMAKRAQEPSEKEALLLSSRKILKNLLEKYPSSSFNQKINSHIAIIEEALAKLRGDSS
jgi:hypothetical protein